ncbi:MAG: hypothetical protein KAT77_03650 [Nanoarchaeota archaeon]|nr:hypothetical protein [Nanoarchaeota archaeon]
MTTQTPIFRNQKGLSFEPVKRLDDIKGGDDIVIVNGRNYAHFVNVKPSAPQKYPSHLHGLPFQGEYLVLESGKRVNGQYLFEERKLSPGEFLDAVDTVITSSQIEQGHVYKFNKEFSIN